MFIRIKVDKGKNIYLRIFSEPKLNKKRFLYASGLNNSQVNLHNSGEWNIPAAF